MKLAQIDSAGIYRGMVDAVAATPPDVGWYPPEGLKVSPLGSPPTDEAGKWRDNGSTWAEVTAEEIAAVRRAEILARLDQIDREMLRPLDAKDEVTAVEYDLQKLAALRAEKKALRAELAGLG